MGSFNYQLCETLEAVGNKGFQLQFAVYEIYYDEDGKPIYREDEPVMLSDYVGFYKPEAESARREILADLKTIIKDIANNPVLTLREMAVLPSQTEFFSQDKLNKIIADSKTVVPWD